MDAGREVRFLIIANPTAGRGGAARLARQVHRRLRRRAAESRIEIASACGQAEFIARAALGEAASDVCKRLCVVACGGDGTVQAVVNALLNAPDTGAALGLAPAGRCNDFASAFGIGRDPEHITQVLLAGRTRRVDLGRVNQRYFCTVAAMGFDAAVSRYANDMKAPLSGMWAYLYASLRVLTTYEPVTVRLALDHATIEGPVFLAASANTPTYGGRWRIAPNADACDGMLDVCVVAVLSRWRVLRLLPCVLRGRHADLPEVRLVRTRSVKIESDAAYEIWGDGEFVAKTPATVEAVPGALRLRVPGTPRA